MIILPTGLFFLQHTILGVFLLLIIHKLILTPPLQELRACLKLTSLFLN